MRNLIIVMIFMFASLSFAQRNISFTAELPDTLSGADTTTYTPGTVVDKYAGVIGFQVTYTGDTIKTVTMQGSFDGDTWTAVSTQDKDAGTYWLTETTPVYWYYRLWCASASIDTAVVTKVRFIYKEE